MSSTTEPFYQLVTNLANEGRLLSGRDILIRDKERYVFLYYISDNITHTYARIEYFTGNIYSTHGSIIRGNIFSAPYYGFDAIDANGVITYKSKRSARIAKLHTFI